MCKATQRGEEMDKQIKKEVLTKFRRYISKGVKGKNALVAINKIMNEYVTDELIGL